MSTLSARCRTLAVLSLLAIGAAACGRGGTRAMILTPEQVGGVYSICSLTFAPAGPGRPALNLRALMDPDPGQNLPVPRVRLSPTRNAFVLEYVPAGDLVERRFDHTYRTGPRTVMLDFPNPAEAMSVLLLPASLELEFVESPRSLRITDSYREHRVPRADYQRLSGIQDPNLADPVVGTLSGNFRVGSCS